MASPSPKSQASLWDENLKPTMQNLFEVSLSKKPQIKDSSAKQNIFLQNHVDNKPGITWKFSLIIPFVSCLYSD